MKNILIVPDKFKGSLTSLQAAQAIQAGLEKQFTIAAEGSLGVGHVDGGFCARGGEGCGDGVRFQIVEIADGGDGSLDVVAGRLPGAQLVEIAAHNPIGKKIATQILLYQAARAENAGDFCSESPSGEFCAEKGIVSCSDSGFAAVCAEKEGNSCSDSCGGGFCAEKGAVSCLKGGSAAIGAGNGGDSCSDSCGGEFCAEKGAVSCSEGAEWRAFIEMAKVSGLAMLEKEERNPLYTSTYGLGEAICAARRMGARKITLSIGGSATDDCGAGMLQALGYQFFNCAGELISAPICGKDLQDVARIEQPCTEEYSVYAEKSPQGNMEYSGGAKVWAPQACCIEVICDVDNPLLGENGATAIYAPQKGATPEALVQLERGKANFAQAAERCLGVDPQMKFLPGAGAAGGVGYAGTALLGGELLSGWKFFTEITSLEEKVRWADVVVTGEGSVDSQSLSGKIVGGIMELARKYGKPVEIFCGVSSLDQLPQGVRCHSLVSIEPDTQVCMTHAAELLERLAEGVELQ